MTTGSSEEKEIYRFPTENVFCEFIVFVYKNSDTTFHRVLKYAMYVNVIKNIYNINIGGPYEIVVTVKTEGRTPVLYASNIQNNNRFDIYCMKFPKLN